MAMDTRDYYVERLRKAAGYVERAAFRVPLGFPGQKKPAEGGWWWPVVWKLMLVFWVWALGRGVIALVRWWSA